MPAIELAANLRLANSEVKYLGPVNMAGFNQLCCQLTSLGLGSTTGNTASVTATAEVSQDQANWAAGGGSGDNVKVDGGGTSPVVAPTTTSLHTLLSSANQGAAFVRIKVEASATGAGTVALWVNTFNS